MRVEQGIVCVADPGQLHDTRVVHQHIDASERCLGGVEHASHGVGIGYVRLGSDRVAACSLDLGYDGRRRFFAAGVVHDDVETIQCQAFGHGRANSARGAGDDCGSGSCVGHGGPFPFASPVLAMTDSYAFDGPG